MQEIKVRPEETKARKKETKIRLLKAGEIEVRVQGLKKSSKGVGCVLLLYKDARVDMKILDETFGIKGWKRTHEIINGNLFCNIDIWDDEKNQWVRKQDVGVESYTEKQKGQASDSFKRAGFNIGIGRELYTAPFIWVNLKQGEFIEKNGKLNLNPKIHFKVKFIDYNEKREISSIEIVDSNHVVRYSFGKHTEESKGNATGKLECEQCGANISEKVASYSQNQFGHMLCMSCQKKLYGNIS